MMSTESKINTWGEYLNVIEENSLNTHIFRGESSSSYSLKPGVGRQRKGSKNYSMKMETQLLENFRQKIALLVQANQLDEWDMVAFAQHVGVPTRLLDWSLSPLVALFFALEGTGDHDRVVYVYKIKSFVSDEEKKGSPLNVKGIRTFIPKQFHPRIKAQRGVFTVHERPTDVFESSNLRKITIAGPSVEQLRKNLFKMGIDYWHVYPDAEGIGKQLKWQFEFGVPSTG